MRFLPHADAPTIRPLQNLRMPLTAVARPGPYEIRSASALVGWMTSIVHAIRD